MTKFFTTEQSPEPFAMIRTGIKRPGLRFLSTPTISYNDVIAGQSSSSTCGATITDSTDKKPAKITPGIGLWTALPSAQVVNSLSNTHFHSVVDTDLKVKHEFCNMLRNKQYDLLCEVLLTLTEQNRWHLYLTQAEIGFFISHLVKHQLNGLFELTRLKKQKYSVAKSLIDAQEQGVKRLKDNIRQIYCYLVYSKTGRPEDTITSLYHRKVRKVFYRGNLTGHKLLISDYENLIELEYGNNKLDLALKGLERFYQQGFTNKDMTPKLWEYLLKLAGGDPRFWRVFRSDVYKFDYKVEKGYYTLKNFSTMLADYLEYNKGDEHLSWIINCLGRQGDIYNIYKILGDRYGIVAEPQSRDPGSGTKFVKDPEVIETPTPSFDVITALVSSLSFNKKYFEVMRLINLFQTEFELDLTSKQSKAVWETLIHWSDLSTRFSKTAALQHFIRNHNPQAATTMSHEEALKDPNFDYEAYLQYFDNLKTTRNSVMKQIWALYQPDAMVSSEHRFSVKNFTTYGLFLKQLRDEEEWYKYFSNLGRYYHQFYTSPESFNRKHLDSNRVVASIYNVYYTFMTSFIRLKVETEKMGQIPYLIDEWSLDEEMKKRLHQYYKQNLRQFTQIVESKRTKQMVEQRSQDEESLLELF